MTKKLAVLGLSTLLALGCQTPGGYRADDPSVPPSPHGAVQWKAILIAGDNSIPAFDNAVRDVATMFERRGVRVVATFTADRAKAARGLTFVTHESLDALAARVRVSAGEGCIVFATSHGTVHGLNLPRDPRNTTLSPAELTRALAGVCGSAPTILVISACHSGTFIRASTARPDVIILTASQRHRKSFGCRAERQYTYYDGCLLTEYPRATTWADLHARLLACVQTKETGLRDLPSEPQAFFGARMKDLPLPGLR